MEPLTKCKSCGYVMAAAKLKDRCPACGVPAKMFEPYTEKISPPRKFLLALDIHPVFVHFTQAFTASVLVLSGLALVSTGGLLSKVTSTIAVLGAALPGVILLTFLAGMLDGKIRFRRVTTPLLKKKMALGGLLFLFSLGIAAVTVFWPLDSAVTLISLAGLALPALGCATLLAFWGVSLLNAKFPG
jgi:hypothetical protein